MEAKVASGFKVPSLLADRKQESTRIKVPVRPTPALERIKKMINS